MPDTTLASRKRANRIWMAAALFTVLAIPSTLYFAIGVIAKQRAQAHKHTFYEYVVTHHVGQLTEIDDGTGLTPMSYVLTLRRPPPDPEAKAFVERLMRLYVQWDHGQILTVVYIDPHSGKQRALADAEYNDDLGRLTVTLFHRDGKVTKSVTHVDW